MIIELINLVITYSTTVNTNEAVQNAVTLDASKETAIASKYDAFAGSITYALIAEGAEPAGHGATVSALLAQTRIVCRVPEGIYLDGWKSRNATAIRLLRNPSLVVMKTS